MTRPSIEEQIKSTKAAIKKDPSLKDTYTSRTLDYTDTQLHIELKIRGAGVRTMWIPRVKK